MKKLATLLMLFIALLGNTIFAQTDTTKTHIKSFLVKSNFEQRVAGLKGLSINSYITLLVNQTNNPNFNFTTQGKFIAGEYNTAVNNGKAQNHWTEKQLPLFIEIGKELQGTYPFNTFNVPAKVETTEEAEEFDFSEILEEQENEIKKKKEINAEKDKIITEEDKKSAEKDKQIEALNYLKENTKKYGKEKAMKMSKEKYPDIDFDKLLQ